MHTDDPLRPALGIVNGVILGALLWAAILGAIWLTLQ